MVTYEFSLDDEFLLIKYSKPIDLVSDQNFCLLLSERKPNCVPCSGIFLQVSSFSVPPCKVSILVSLFWIGKQKLIEIKKHLYLLSDTIKKYDSSSDILTKDILWFTLLDILAQDSWLSCCKA